MSDIDETKNLGRSLVYKAVSPIRWEPVAPSMLTEHAEQRMCSSNEAVIHAYSALDDKQDAYSDEVTHTGELHAELLALDLKVNFLLDMVSELLFIHHELPAERAISLTSTTLEWAFEDEPVPEVGQHVLVKVYLSRVYMRPFQLLGVVESVDQALSIVKLCYEIPSPYLHELLEKMIFRYHRRMIAQSKMSND